MSRDSVFTVTAFLCMMRHKWEECSLVHKVFGEHQSCTGCLACIFSCTTRRGRALSAVQCLGLDLASLVMALGLWHVTLSQRLVVSPLLTAQWLGDLVVAAHGLSGIELKRTMPFPGCWGCLPACCFWQASISGDSAARRETGCSICCWGRRH